MTLEIQDFAEELETPEAVEPQTQVHANSAAYLVKDYGPVWIPSEIDVADFQNRIKLRRQPNPQQDR